MNAAMPGAATGAARVRTAAAPGWRRGLLALAALVLVATGHAGCSRGAPCGGASCTATQICVAPTCCTECLPRPDAGACAGSAALATCPTTGKMSCVTACSPAPSHCVEVPKGCTETRPCKCLESGSVCAHGGACVEGATPAEDVLGCVPCF